MTNSRHIKMLILGSGPAGYTAAVYGGPPVPFEIDGKLLRAYVVAFVPDFVVSSEQRVSTQCLQVPGASNRGYRF